MKAASLLLLVLSLASLQAGETITVDGKQYPNSEMIEVAPDGPAFRTEEGEVVILPWSDVSSAQLSAIKAKYPDAITNAMYEAYHVKGSVFHVNDDGHIIQIDVQDGDDFLGFQSGAVVPDQGLVIIKDIPTSVPQGVGKAIEIVAHKRRTYTFNIGIAAKEIPYLTVARPIWGAEQEWTNVDGQVMHARLVAVKDGKGLFEKGGNRFVYELEKLDAESRERADEIAAKLAKFPMP
jgi:hypothetical protein